MCVSCLWFSASRTSAKANARKGAYSILNTLALRSGALEFRNAQYSCGKPKDYPAAAHCKQHDISFKVWDPWKLGFCSSPMRQSEGPIANRMGAYKVLYRGRLLGVCWGEQLQ